MRHATQKRPRTAGMAVAVRPRVSAYSTRTARRRRAGGEGEEEREEEEGRRKEEGGEGRKGGETRGGRPAAAHTRECPRSGNARSGQDERGGGNAHTPAGTEHEGRRECPRDRRDREGKGERRKRVTGEGHEQITAAHAATRRMRSRQRKAEEAKKKIRPSRGGGAHGRGQPSTMVSGKVAVRVGVAGVSSAVAAESSLPGGMDPGGLAARERSRGCPGRSWSPASPGGHRAWGPV